MKRSGEIGKRPIIELKMENNRECGGNQYFTNKPTNKVEVHAGSSPAFSFN